MRACNSSIPPYLSPAIAFMMWVRSFLFCLDLSNKLSTVLVNLDYYHISIIKFISQYQCFDTGCAALIILTFRNLSKQTYIRYEPRVARCNHGTVEKLPAKAEEI